MDEKAPTIDVAALAAKAAADAPTATPVRIFILNIKFLVYMNNIYIFKKPELAAEALKAAATVIAQTVADAAKV